MKRIMKRLLTLALLCATVLSLASCSFIQGLLGGGVPDGFKGSYTDVENTDSATINQAAADLNKLGGTKYTATYSDTEHRKYTNNGVESEYTRTYEVKASINLDATVGEALALYTLRSIYDQGDPQYDYDATVEICIVRTGDGNDYSDHTVYAKYGENKYSATFEQMFEKLEDSDSYVSPFSDAVITEAYYLPDYETPYYLELVTEWASAVTGIRLSSIGDPNPLAAVNHGSCKDKFVSALSSISGSSSSHTYTFGKTDDGMYRLIDKLNYKVNNVTIESGETVQYIKVSEGDTYSYNYDYTFKRDVNVDLKEIAITRTLEPLTGSITLPEFAK